MKKFGEFFKNIGFLTLGNLSTKFISFLLVPLYTNILTTSEYGIFDLVNNTVTILVPLFTLNICDSVFRFIMDKTYDPDEVITYSLKIFSKGMLAIFFISILNKVFNLVPVFNKYLYFFLGLYCVCSYNTIITNLARGKDRIFDISISGVLSSGVMIALNIFTLVVLKWGIKGYFIANIIGILTQCTYLTVTSGVFQHLKLPYKRNVELEKAMRTYSKPLMINSLAWWVNSVSDRYIVIWFCGIAVNGIYSIAYKVPSIINIFHTIFGQVWTLFAIKEIEEDAKSIYFSKVYSAYNLLVVFVCELLILINRPMAKVLYAKDFYEAWRYVPFLLISSLFSALSAYAGGVFAAGKESKSVMNSTLIGAAINSVFNVLLTPLLGALGAAVATAISYFVVWSVRMQEIQKVIELQYNKTRNLSSYMILIIQCILFLICNNVILTIISQVVCGGILILMYYKEIENLVLTMWKSYREG